MKTQPSEPIQFQLDLGQEFEQPITKAQNGRGQEPSEEVVRDLIAEVGEAVVRGYPNPTRLAMYVLDYRRLHNVDKLLSGKILKEQRVIIADLIKSVAEKLELASTLDAKVLDYGSGKGAQYLAGRVHEKWGGSLPTCYDPGVAHLNKRPSEKFDGVICTDVMEHIDRLDIGDVLADIGNYLKPGPCFAYFHISCRPARKKFMPNSLLVGEDRDLHLTVKSPEWWDLRLSVLTKNRPDLQLAATYEK